MTYIKHIPLHCVDLMNFVCVVEWFTVEIYFIMSHDMLLAALFFAAFLWLMISPEQSISKIKIASYLLMLILLRLIYSLLFAALPKGHCMSRKKLRSHLNFFRFFYHFFAWFSLQHNFMVIYCLNEMSCK